MTLSHRSVSFPKVDHRSSSNLLAKNKLLEMCKWSRNDISMSLFLEGWESYVLLFLRRLYTKIMKDFRRRYNFFFFNFFFMFFII